MKLIMEKWNSFLQEQTTEKVYAADAILAIDTEKRNKESILSDIRSITGVTIVKSDVGKQVGVVETSNLRIKVDDSLLRLFSPRKIKKHIEMTVNTKIPGVRNFRFLDDLEAVEDV